MLTRAGARCSRGSGRSLGVLCALVLSACAVDSLDRLGAGNSLTADADAGPALNGPLRPGSGQLDAGTQPEPVSPEPASLTLPVPDPDLAPEPDAGGSAPALGGELMPNPSFEEGHEGWVGFGNSRIHDVAEAHSGARAILSTNRVRTWEGPSYDIRPLIQPGQAYSFSVWVRNELDTQMILLTLKSSCAGEEVFTRLATRAVGTGWLQLAASFFAPDCARLDELSLYVEGPPAYKNLLVDDVSLQAVTLSGGVESAASGSGSSASAQQ